MYNILGLDQGIGRVFWSLVPAPILGPDRETESGSDPSIPPINLCQNGTFFLEHPMILFLVSYEGQDKFTSRSRSRSKSKSIIRTTTKKG